MYTSSLHHNQQYDRATMGGKALHLGELISAGLPVPPGFLVLTSAYEYFVKTNNLQTEIERLAQSVFPEEPATAEIAAQAIAERFEQGALPAEIEAAVLAAYQQLDAPTVAVRSSATAEDLPGSSFAGLQDTFLGLRSAVEVVSALKRCWASLWSARALIYRTRQHIAHHTVRMAVIVQQMVESSASGILFTCNPVTGMRDEMIINASWGLGEAIVSGQVNPDTITLDKQSGRVKTFEGAEKLVMTVPTVDGVATQAVPFALRQQPVLSSPQIARLFELGQKIEQYFATPQDIEWAIADDQIFLVQTRPVTTQALRQTITVRQEELSIPGDDAWEKREKPVVHPYDLWTHTNIGENFLDPITPLSATLWPTFFVLGRLPSKDERAPGAPPLPVLGERFYGRMYVNEGAIIHGAMEMGIPTSFLDSTWGSSGRGLRSSDDTIHLWRGLRRLPSMIGEARKVAKEQAKQRPEAPKQPEQPKQKQPRRSPEQLFAQIDTWVDAFQSLDLSQLDDHGLWEYVPLWIERGKTLRPILVAAALAGISFYFLERKVNKWTGQVGQATALLQALSGVYTAEVGSMLWHMARTLSEAGLAGVVQEHPAEEALELLQVRPEAQPFLDKFEAFLQRHGYRCPNDAELHNPRWAEQPKQVVEMLKNYGRMDESANPLALEHQRQQEREETTKRLRAQINPLRRPLFNWLLKQAQNKTRLRDNNRSYVAKFLLPMRLLLVEFGRRWADRGWLADPDDIFFLTLYEIGDIISAENPFVQGFNLSTTTAARRIAFDYWHTISAPTALGPGGVPLPDPQPTGTYLQGLPACTGRIRGTARLIESINEAATLVPGEILVTRCTDPGWTPIFPLASGLVLETGGLLSHGAIIAREYGVPAVINVPGALSHIKSGQTIEVDGANGRIYLDLSESDGTNESISLNKTESRGREPSRIS
jgi:pyruvate,water dikinase